MSNGDLASLFGNAEGFDPMSVNPQDDYPVIPPGDYPIEIRGAEMKVTKSGAGKFLELSCIVLAQPTGSVRSNTSQVVGFKLFDRLNLENPSQVAVEIAQRSLAALGRSLGIQRMKDSQQLIGGRCLACVKVKEGNNEIRTYKPLPVAPAAPIQPTQTAPLPPSRQIAHQPDFQQPIPMQTGQQATNQPVNPVGGPVAAAPTPVAPPADVPAQVTAPAAAPGPYQPAPNQLVTPPPASVPVSELPKPWQAQQENIPS